MARYMVEINNDSYILHSASKKNWELGTVNDFMLSLNGWHTVEHSIREVIWRLRMFQGETWLNDEYSEDNSEENYGMSDRYTKWLGKKCNTVRYFDRLCGFERTHLPRDMGLCRAISTFKKSCKI